MLFRLLLPALLAVLTLAVPGPARDKESLTEKEALALATDAYVYGYPLITMEMTRRVMTNAATPKDNHAPMGQFYNSRTYPDARFRDVTAPNADTLYSTAWLDLAKEPYVLSLPDMDGRYFLMPLLDAWTDVFAVPGKRTTGTKAQKYGIVGPGWKGKLPEGVKPLHSPTNLVWILGRTYCTGTAKDYKAVHALQDKYDLVPLSAYGKKYTPPSGKVDPKIDMKTAVRKQVADLKPGDYFTLMAKLMKDNPATRADAPVVARLAKLGIIPGKTFDIDKSPAPIARALKAAPKAAVKVIIAQEKKGGKEVNGWLISTQTGRYGTDYAQRAFITAIGLGANRPQDAVYPMCKVDSDGKKLDGANKYTLTFAKGQLPPVNGFWSLTMYNAAMFFVDNKLNRYTLSQRNTLKPNKDGSVTLYLQHNSPDKGKESNWLPAPKGEFVLMLRLYWPKVKAPSIIDGSWKPAAVKKSK